MSANGFEPRQMPTVAAEAADAVGECATARERDRAVKAGKVERMKCGVKDGK